MSDEICVKVHSYGNGRALSLVYRDPITGKKVAKSSGTTDPGTAERAAAVLEDELRSGRFQAASKVTWESFVERYTQEKLSSLAPKTTKAASVALDHFKEAINVDRLVKVTSAVMSRFQSKMRAGGMKDTTLAKNLRHLRAAFSWAVSVGMLAAVPNMHMPKRAKGQAMMKGRPITGEEFDRLLLAIPAALVEVSQRQRKKEPKRKVKVKPKVVTAKIAESWRHYLNGLWLSGLRLEESLILAWDDDEPFSVDLSGRHPAFRILGKAQKSGRDEVLPMTPDFAEFILRTPEEDRRGPVFRPIARDKSEPMNAGNVGAVVAAIGRAAKVVTNKAEGRYATAHDLRRSFGTRWAKRVMPAVLRRLMRHSAIQTTMAYYVELDAAEVADDLWAKFSAEGIKAGPVGNKTGNIAPGNDNGHGETTSAKSCPVKG
jgi:integrase